MQHLLDFFDRYVHGSWTALLHDDGLRRWSYTADQLRATSEAFARRVHDADLRPGDRLVIWSDSCPEWLAVFWGAMLRGVAVIPLDARTSPEHVRRVIAISAPRGIVTGDGVDTALIPPPVRTWRLRDIRWTNVPVNTSRVEPSPDTVAEIVFTSGTSGDPKGVVITHRNIVANITPVGRAAVQYGRYLWLFRPLRFLGLLPLSHMFGQALTVFLPPLVRATTVFIKGYSPQEIVSAVRRYRITLAVAVPRFLDLLRDRVQQLAPSSQHLAPAGLPFVRRLWRHRDAHRLFGRTFCGFVVGGAQLDPDLEQFWQRLGFAVIQGYGLTETAPIVAWNNPFRISHGTVGMPLEGVEVRIAPDGEVLVRGPSVTSGYVNAPEETRSAFEGGWFHTGDLGSFDEAGHLRIRGRKKDVIVTGEGVHVVPDDVERALEGVSGVREAAVVARTDGDERVHAVLVLEPGTDGAAVIRRANANLESHQRIRDFSVWPGQALPRTEAIRKLKRGEIRRWVAEGAPLEPRAMQSAADSLDTVLARYAPGRNVSPGTTLDELGLTSLDRIELTMALEECAGVGLSDAAMGQAQTVDDIRHVVDEAGTGGTNQETFPFPRWTRRLWAKTIRDGSQLLWVLPLASIFMRRRVEGQVHLSQLRGPVIFASNHQSHFDTPAILSSLPLRRRRHLAVAMAKDFFEPHFAPPGYSTLERVTSGALYYLAVLFFSAFPLPRTGPGTRDTLRYAGELATSGVSILIFPEGHRTEHGEINAFQPGVGMMASKLRMPVVPIRLEGLDRVLHHTWRWPRHGTVRVSFGPPLELEGDDYAGLASRVEHAVRALLPEPTPASRSDAA